MKKNIRIGGASGFWGDSYRATSQLLKDDSLDFIVYDYLAEITMSIMARARAKNPDMGYATDFTDTVIKQNIKRISDRGIKIISNAGGVNPEACAESIKKIISTAGLNLKVVCITGDDLLASVNSLKLSNLKEMFSDEDFPDIAKIASVNAYLGAFPIAKALDRGADIVITGRCVDSAVTLGACIHSFNWKSGDLDRLANGSLAGHILECGAQATGGNFTDWQLSKDIENIGYPITEISDNGHFIVSKLDETGGLINLGTISEQLLYEIGDPQSYMLPDVTCDFSEVSLEQISKDVVKVSGAKGRPPNPNFKVSATYADGFRGGTMMTIYGENAAEKADYLSKSILKASRQTLSLLGRPDFSETSVELIGAESQYGEFAAKRLWREVSLKIAVKHPEAQGVGVLLKECVGLGLATPPGLSGFQGGRARPSPVVRLFSFEIPKSKVKIFIDNVPFEKNDPNWKDTNFIKHTRPDPPVIKQRDDLMPVKLIKLAYGRSGDKGDSANIGVICREPEFLEYVYQSLTEKVIAERLSHFINEDSIIDCEKHVKKFLLPGLSAINFLITNVLGGGGVASIRNDAQGKGFAQIILETPILVPQEIANQVS